MSDDTVSPETRSKLAQSVLRNNLGVKPGEHVIIEAWTHTLPWAVAFGREARRLGAKTMIPYEDEGAYWDTVEAGKTSVLGKAADHEFAALGKSDVYIHMWGPGDRVRLGALPDKQQDALFEWNSEWYQVAAKNGVRGARMELGRPFPSVTEAYGVQESQWVDQLVRATMVTPQALAKTAAPISRALARGKRVRIHDDRGTDLTLGLIGRPPVVIDGRPETVSKGGVTFRRLVTLPSGLIRVPLSEKVAEGTIVANRTNYYDDAVARGAVFQFSGGKLTSAQFEEGQERWEKGFSKGGKGRDRPGLLGIGLNPELHNTPQLEDTELGALMVSVGGNRGWGGTNTSPFFGWAINAGATLEVDGKEIPLRA
jgi:leucyl aminopeptidase (aminopeptidase T)